MPDSAHVPSVEAASTCILCRRNTVQVFLDLGETALANRFLRADELSLPEPRYPLRIGFCHTCGHVQLVDRVPPGEMFDDYLYISSASDTLRSHLYALSDYLVGRLALGADDLVVDVGCNDGTLLSGFRRHGVRTLGVDPARNLAELTREMGIDRFVGYFNSATAPYLQAKWGRASLITATNTFPHIQDPWDFVDAVKTTLRSGGVFVAEMHYLLDLVDQSAFDTIYHEHVSYWALEPMRSLFEAGGMEIVDAERVPLHHGQLRVFVQRKGEGRVQLNVGRVLEMERRRGLRRFETYTQFAETVKRIQIELRRTLEGVKAQGKRLAGYGAPAKASTLLSVLGIGPDLVEYIVDRSTLKQGLFLPGLHIPVVSPDRLKHDLPDYLLLLAWNFADEILEQQRQYRERGGRFIIPVPEVTVV